MSASLATIRVLDGGSRVGLKMTASLLSPETYSRDSYSQLGEGSALWNIFRVIRSTDKLAVEFGAGNGTHLSNTAFLRKEHGWEGILFDAEPRGDDVYKARLTVANIGNTFRRHNIPEQFDLLSIDVDGNDFWLWDALVGFEPRVVVVEYNSNFGANESVAIQYDPYHEWDSTMYYGASLRALWKLGKSRGYSLVGISHTLNAFFVQRELLIPIARDHMPEEFWLTGASNHLPDNANRSWVHI